MEEKISEWYGAAIKIVEQRGEYIMFSEIEYDEIGIVNSDKMSFFSSPSEIRYDTDTMFKICKKLSELEELLKYNFNNCKISEYSDYTLDIDSKYLIYIRGADICISCSNILISKFDLEIMSIYDILDHPVLQPYRINHSKPVNKNALLPE